jgi:hypothetical protein
MGLGRLFNQAIWRLRGSVFCASLTPLVRARLRRSGNGGSSFTEVKDQICSGSSGSGSRTGASGFSMGLGGSLIGGGMGSAGVRRRNGGRAGTPGVVSACMGFRCGRAGKGSLSAECHRCEKPLSPGLRVVAKVGCSDDYFPQWRTLFLTGLSIHYARPLLAVFGHVVGKIVRRGRSHFHGEAAFHGHRAHFFFVSPGPGVAIERTA